MAINLLSACPHDQCIHREECILSGTECAAFHERPCDECFLSDICTEPCYLVHGLYLRVITDARWSKEEIWSPVSSDKDDTGCRNPLPKAADSFGGRHWFLPQAISDEYPQLEQSETYGLIPHSLPPVFRDPRVARIWREDVCRGRPKSGAIDLKYVLDVGTQIALFLMKPSGPRYLPYEEIAEVLQLNSPRRVVKMARGIEAGVRENAASRLPKRIAPRELQYFLPMLKERLSSSTIAIREGVSTRTVQMALRNVIKKICKFRLISAGIHTRPVLLSRRQKGDRHDRSQRLYPAVRV